MMIKEDKNKIKVVIYQTWGKEDETLTKEFCRMQIMQKENKSQCKNLFS